MESTGEGPSLTFLVLSGLPSLYGKGKSRYFSLALQVPTVCLLGASQRHVGQKAPLWSFFPESTVPVFGAKGQVWDQHGVLLAQWYFSREVAMFFELHLLRNRVV